MGGACGTYCETKNAYMVLLGKPEGKRLLGDLGLDGKIILRWIIKK
jgi:hypothetical protein